MSDSENKPKPDEEKSKDNSALENKSLSPPVDEGDSPKEGKTVDKKESASQDKNSENKEEKSVQTSEDTPNEVGEIKSDQGSEGAPSEDSKIKVTVPKEIKDKEEPKPKFKEHPIFGRKTRREDQFHNQRQSKVNPYMSILDQHVQSQYRIAKIVAVVFLVLAMIVLTCYGYNWWRKECAKNAKITRIKNRIAQFDKTIAEKKNYPKFKAALNSIIWVEKLMTLDRKNLRHWQREKEKYVAVLQDSKPLSQSDFVNPTAFIDMVYLPPGRFFMGRRANERGNSDELPRHPVVILDEMWIGRTEVSFGQFRAFQANCHIEKWKHYILDKTHQPVVKLSWHDAMNYCKLLTERESKANRIPADYEYRLPTEAEWEYACRAGTTTYFYWGDKFGKEGGTFANSLDKYSAKLFGWKGGAGMAPNDGHRVSAPIGFYKANAFNLFDTSGNVWEWCLDWYNPKAYRELSETNPFQDQPVVAKLKRFTLFDAGTYEIESTFRVIRGGSWGNLPNDCRSASRDYEDPEQKNSGIGFRVVLAKKIKIL